MRAPWPATWRLRIPISRRPSRLSTSRTRASVRAEIGIRSLQVAGHGARIHIDGELPQVVVALGQLPEHEVDLGTHADEAVRAKLHPLLPSCDDVGERFLAGCALLDRKPPPGRVDPVERVRDVLSRALRCHGAIVAARVTPSALS